MRRKEREILDDEVIDSILLECECIRLGFSDKKCPYIVPLNFGFEHVNGKRIFYFHGAKAGKKKELIESNGYAGFELDTKHKLVKAKEACEYTYGYQSIIGNGSVQEITMLDEKYHALNIIMKHYSGKDNWEYPEEMVKRLYVFQLEVEEISCKSNQQ